MKAFILLFLIAVSALALPDDKMPTKDREPRELVRDPDSVQYFDATVLVTEQDGKPKVHYSVKVPRGVQSLAGRYRYTEDLNRGTYKIIEVEKWDTMGGIDPDINEKAIQPHIPEPGDGCPCGGQECLGQIELTVRNYALEPSTLNEILFTKTKAKGGWRRRVDYITRTCKWENYTPASVSCSILNPNPFTWYPNGANPCAQAGPTLGGNGVWWMYGQGSYKNKNWALPLLWSYVTDLSEPGITHGVVDLDWDHYPSGDGALFLYGEFEVVLINTCMS